MGKFQEEKREEKSGKNLDYQRHESTRAYRLLPGRIKSDQPYRDRKFFNFQASKLESDHVIIENCVPAVKGDTESTSR